MEENIKNSINYWNNVHKEYTKEDIKYDDWLQEFNDIIDNCKTPILDLGCGSGNNTLYLMNQKKQVVAADLSSNAIENIQKNFPEIYDTKCFNMLDGFPFPNHSFEVIIADLSLHYFKKEDTKKVIKELERILTPNGYLMIRVNSIHDINHGAGQGLEIEEHLYQTEDGRLKRFFNEEDIREFFQDFKILYLKEESMTRYKLEKKLYRVCMQKGRDNDE